MGEVVSKYGRMVECLAAAAAALGLDEWGLEIVKHVTSTLGPCYYRALMGHFSEEAIP